MKYTIENIITTRKNVGVIYAELRDEFGRTSIKGATFAYIKDYIESQGLAVTNLDEAVAKFEEVKASI